jgi:hypothetical protein
MTGPINGNVGEFYRQTSVRNDWNNPTREQMVKSLNLAHDANRQLEAEMGRLQAQFQATKKRLFFSNVKNVLLMAFVGGLAAKGIEVAVIALIKAFAH